MTKTDREYIFVHLNLQKDKHKDLIEWIKTESEENEQSLSAFCILMLKKCMQEAEKDGE